MVRLNAVDLAIGLVLLNMSLCSMVEGQQKPTSTLTRRHEIRDLDEVQLQELRDAFQNAFTNGAYMAVAKDHGQPNHFCPHASLRFLPWRKSKLHTESHLTPVKIVALFAAWRKQWVVSRCCTGIGLRMENQP